MNLVNPEAPGLLRAAPMDLSVNHKAIGNHEEPLSESGTVELSALLNSGSFGLRIRAQGGYVKPSFLVGILRRLRACHFGSGFGLVFL